MTECHLRAALAVAVWLRLRRRKNGRAFAALGPLRDGMNGLRGQELWRGRAFVTPSVLSITSRNPLECDLVAVAETLCTRRGGTASLAWSLAFSNQMALNSALTVRPLALNVALGLIACPLMKVHGGGANRRHPNSPRSRWSFTTVRPSDHLGSTPRWRVRSWSV
jgi:hypothetical protein